MSAMTDMRRLLESERDVERTFMASGRANSKGWSAALTKVAPDDPDLAGIKNDPRFTTIISR